MTEVAELADDLLITAEAIGKYIGLNQRQIYNLIANSDFPAFRLGNILCARKSSIKRYIEEQESTCKAAKS